MRQEKYTPQKKIICEVITQILKQINQNSQK